MINGQGAQQRRDWRIWGGVLVVFVCGLLVGTVATSAYSNYERQHRWEQGLAGMKPRVMKHLARELHLSEDQRHAVDVIVSQAEAPKAVGCTRIFLRGSLFSLPKILKLLQLIRLPNECIEQSEIGIIHHGRSEPVFLPQRRA